MRSICGGRRFVIPSSEFDCQHQFGYTLNSLPSCSKKGAAPICLDQNIEMVYKAKDCGASAITARGRRVGNGSDASVVHGFYEAIRAI